MKFSIIISTRNRADHLRGSLVSIGEAKVPAGWSGELIVVDNGSTDHTAEVIRQASIQNLVKEYQYERKPGLSAARNCGLQVASGEIILFTDDDVRVPPDWIQGMCQPILRGECDAVAGGVVFPERQEQAMRELGINLEPYRSWFAGTGDLGKSQPSRMVGANMAIHRRIVDRGLRFDEEVGPGAVGFGDDTLFAWRLLAAGYTLRSALEVAVDHWFDVTRLTPEALHDVARRFGKTRAFFFHHWELCSSKLAPIYWLYYRMLRLVLSQHPKLDLKRRMSVEEKVGFYSEYFRQWRRPQKYRDFARDFSLSRS